MEVCKIKPHGGAKPDQTQISRKVIILYRPAAACGGDCLHMSSRYVIICLEVFTMAKARLIFDVFPEEKEWLEKVILAADPGQTKVGLLRQLLDDYAKKKKLPARPGSERGGK
jgi:hypothetical protein